MLHLSGLKGSIGSALQRLGEKLEKASASEATTDPELAQWKRQGKPSEDRAAAVRAIEGAAQFGRPKLRLRGLGLEGLPAAVARLHATEEVDLGKNKLTAWPAALGGLNKLQALDISVNQIAGIPHGIAKNALLESLTARSNWIGAIHDDMSKLSHLRKLDLSENNLTHVPAAIQGLPALKDLLLADNKIETLPALDRLFKLKKLNLSNNPLQAIPDGPDDPEEASRQNVQPAAYLPAGLETLKLAGTGLEDIPASDALPAHLGRLKHLKYLDVSSNPLLVRLPLAFGAFKTAGPDKVVSVVSPMRKVELTVLHKGSDVVRGLTTGGRLKGSAGADQAGTSGASASSTEDSDRHAGARRFTRNQRRQTRTTTDVPPAYPLRPEAGGLVPPVLPTSSAGMGVHATNPESFSFPLPRPDPSAGLPQPNAAGAYGAQHYPYTAGLQAQSMPAAANNTLPLPGMLQPGLAAQAGVTNVDTWLRQLGLSFLNQCMQLPQTPMGVMQQPTGQVPMPGAAGPALQPALDVQAGVTNMDTWLRQLGLSYVNRFMQQSQAATGVMPQPPGQVYLPGAAGQVQVPGWAQPSGQARPDLLAQTTVYDGRLAEALRNQSFAVERDLYMQRVIATIPTRLSEQGVDELVRSIKDQIYNLGLNEQSTRHHINQKLIALGQGLRRQIMVDQIAQQDAIARASPNVDARSLSIAYQAFLAHRLGLPGPIMGLVYQLNVGELRSDIFRGLFDDDLGLARDAGVAGTKVEMTERAELMMSESAAPMNDTGDTGHTHNHSKQFTAFLNKQRFWQEHAAQEGQHIRNALYARLRVI